MQITVTETTMKLIGRPLLAILFVLPAIPVITVVAVILGTSFLRSSEPDWILDLLRLIQGWRTLPLDIISLASSSAPALVGVAVLRASRDAPTKCLAKSLVSGLAAATAVSVLCLMFLDPTSEIQAGALTGGSNTISALERAAESSLRLSTTYCLLLVGIRVDLTIRRGTQ